MMKQVSVHVVIVLMMGMFVLCGAIWAGAEEGAEEGGGIKSLLEKSGISVGGFVDTSYSTNLNEPVDRQSRFRVYDTEADSFRLNTTHLFIGREGSDEGGGLNRAGFYFSVDIGKNADVNAPAGTRSDDQIDFQEAYVTYLPVQQFQLAPLFDGQEILGPVRAVAALVGIASFFPALALHVVFGLGKSRHQVASPVQPGATARMVKMQVG